MTTVIPDDKIIPVKTFTKFKDLYLEKNIVFHIEGEEVGKLFLNDKGQLDFEGDASTAARMMFERVKELHKNENH